MTEKKRVKYAHDCRPCSACGDPWCDDCNTHYADCNCIGPHEAEEMGLIDEEGNVKDG